MFIFMTPHFKIPENVDGTAPLGARVPADAVALHPAALQGAFAGSRFKLRTGLIYCPLLPQRSLLAPTDPGSFFPQHFPG